MNEPRLLSGDCREVMRDLADNSFDSIVTDPPYELGFMGKGWDRSGIANDPAMWAEALRVLKPGGHLLAFGGSRTYHRLVCAIEDAGFEVRDQIMWVYGSGFPKSLDVSKAMDKAAGAEREIVGLKRNNKGDSGQQTYAALGTFNQSKFSDITAPATDLARQWQGWGTALKPAHEPIAVARKPLSEGTVAANVARWGTGALNIAACRVGIAPEDAAARVSRNGATAKSKVAVNWYEGGFKGDIARGNPTLGRWPANLIHDGSDEVMDLFAEFGTKRSAGDYPSDSTTRNGATSFSGKQGQLYGDTGTAARFFYCAKSSKADRDAGLDGMPLMPSQKMGGGLKSMVGHPSGKHGNTSTEDRVARNHHPTVKPTALMRYLCRLVTPPGGTILDPFMGSGSTGRGAVLEGFRFIGIDITQDYVTIARKRIADAAA